MTSKEARYYDEVVTLYRDEVETGNKTREQFFIDHGAMKEDGTVIAGYPKVAYMSKGEEKTKDEGGHIVGIKEKVRQLEAESIHAHIKYVPRFYSFVLIYEQSKRKQYENTGEQKR